MKCRVCGADNPVDDLYCGKCGCVFKPAIDQIEEPKEQDWLPPDTWWGWLNQRYWHGMGLPKRGLSILQFTLYWIVVSVITLAFFVLREGPVPRILVPFLAILFVVNGVLMYWVYFTNR